jgi:putative thioredoxin
MSATNFIFEGNNGNFSTLVLENSYRGPVLVNFWAASAGPCLRQYPLLEKLAGEYGGRFLLVNVDTGEEKAIAREYGITSLPLMKLFRNGEAVDELRGYQPERDLRRFLDRHTPRASDAALARALRLYQQGDSDTALTRMVEAALEDPGNLRIPATIAKLLIREQRLQEAHDLLIALPREAREEGEIATLLAHLIFLLEVEQAPERSELERQVEQDENDLEARFRLASRCLVDNDLEEAMTQLLEITRRDRAFREGAGRKGLLALFHILGDKGELVERYRAKLFEILSA